MDDDVLWNNMNAVTDKDTYSAATGLTKRTKCRCWPASTTTTNSATTSP
ncbi:MAG: hypothetical protein ACLRMJ_03730 [Alistipes finegoldii]